MYNQSSTCIRLCIKYIHLSFTISNLLDINVKCLLLCLSISMSKALTEGAEEVDKPFVLLEQNLKLGMS